MKQAGKMLVIGIDVSKKDLHIYESAGQTMVVISNTAQAIKHWVKGIKKLSVSLVVFESTGGYEKLLVSALRAAKLPSHEANPTQVFYFGQMHGHHAKTDGLDARLLSDYGQQAHIKAEPLTTVEKQQLNEMTSRLEQLKQTIVQEKNRAQCTLICAKVRKSIKRHLKFLATEAERLEEEIDTEIKKDNSSQGLRETLEGEKGVGVKVSRVLTAMLPELGKLNREKIARLAGVAPCTKQSGKKHGFQAPRGGRAYVRQMLFVAAMSAVRHNSVLKEYYSDMLARGKKKMVAMIAVVRKLLIHLNSVAKDFYQQQTDIAV